MSIRAVALLAAAVGMAGCTRSVAVTVTEATGVYDASDREGVVRFRTDRSIDRYITTDRENSAIAVFYICGEEGRFETFGDIQRSDGGTYEARLRPISARTVWREDGAVVSGWPAELARQSGVCFRLHASEKLWRTLESDEVALPR